ncbi:MAG: tRNA (guanosine(46)-N7)-methyltransferase TrmB [Lachnospiraceae bacterium]|nr:tRNA (guanosine(46)-N7)-methyltransferase TrmB [Lachnospiraceae bacterium]
MRLRNIPGADDVIEKSEYVINQPENFKGKWSEFFGNKNPIHIEIGMGKGKFITELAKQNPQINYIGIEKYSSVLLRGLEKREEAQKETNLENLFYLCFNAEYIEKVFEKDEVAQIYLNFSDPWPKDRHAKRRLMSRQYLERYDKILADEGRIIFKTDNDGLFDFALEEIEETKWQLESMTRDLHNSEFAEGNIMTEYEEKFSGIGKNINRLVTYR